MAVHNSLVRVLLTAALCAAGVPSASAQESAEGEQVRGTESAGSRTYQPGAEPPDIKPEKLSDEEKRNRVESFLAEQRTGLARLSDLVRQARSAKDMIRLNCLNSKLEQVKGLLKISEAASMSMYEGMAEADEDKVNNQYTRIALARYKSQRLQVEANECVGAKAVFTGNTVIDVTIDDDVSGDDPTAPLPPVVGTVPPVSSGS